MEVVDKVIGVMDPNAFSFRQSIESLVAFLLPQIVYKGRIHRITTERIKNKPYDTLNAKAGCHAIINRGAHWNPHRNSFFQRLSYKTYLLNDMSSFQSISKNTSYGQMHDLGMRIPPTYAIPQEDNSELEFSSNIVAELVFPEFEMFDLREIGEQVGYPAYLKPQDGGGWIGVQKVENYDELLKAYKRSGPKPQNLQKSVENYREFIRCVGMGPQVIPMHYNAKAEYSHDRYLRSKNKPVEQNFLPPECAREVSQICKIINAFYGWDHNSSECLLTHGGDIFLIDFANAYPDSSLVSLHYYFPELVINTVRWLFFIVCSDRRKRIFGYDWNSYLETAEKCHKEGMSHKERLDCIEAIADEHFSTEEFKEFVEVSLGDEFRAKCYDFFASADFEHIIFEEVKRYFKIESEQPFHCERYLASHKIWLADNKA
jgi:hypothetical protein